MRATQYYQSYDDASRLQAKPSLFDTLIGLALNIHSINNTQICSLTGFHEKTIIRSVASIWQELRTYISVRN